MFPQNLAKVESFIGVIFAVVGNILISVALNVQKYAHNELEQSKYSKCTPYTTIAGCQQTRSHRPTSERYEMLINPETDDAYLYLHSKAWWLGILLMVIGEFGNFIAYAFAPASVVAPLGTVALISNVILAPIMLNETFRRQDLMGVAFAVIGAIMVVASSKGSEVTLDPEAIWGALAQSTFLAYFIITLIAGISLMFISSSHGPRCILIDMSLVALSGGYTVLATKGLSSILTLKFVMILQDSITYILGFVLVFTAVLQITYLNKALQRFDSTQVIPTQFVLFTISAIVGSAVLYNDFADTGPKERGFFFFGCFLTFIGVYLITSNRKVTRGRRPQPSRVGSGLFPFHNEYDEMENAPYNQQTATATSIPRRHSLYTRGAHSSTPLLHEQYQSDSLLRSMIHGGASLTAGVGQALNSVGTRHSHALGLGLVFENYLQKIEDEHNEENNGSSDNHHRRSQSVPPVFASQRFGFPSYQNGRAQHSSPSPNSNRVNYLQQYYQQDDANSALESNGHPQSPTTDSYLSRSYTNSSYYDDASGYTDSVHTDDDEVTVSNLTTSSADSGRRIGLYSSDAGSTYDAFPEFDEFQQSGDLPDLPYRREHSAVGVGYSDSDGE